MWFILLAIVYIVVSKDGYHQWDESCFLFEASYDSSSASSCFPQHQFRGNILFLTLLVDIFGKSLFSLFMVDLIYALLVVFSGYFVYKIFEELFEKEKAKLFIVIFMSLPVILYLGHKSIAEVPGLFLSTAAIYLFLLGLRKNNKYSNLFYILSSVLVFFAGVARTDAPIIYAGFLASFFIFPPKKIDRKILFKNYVIITVAFIILFLIFVFIIKFNPFERFISIGPKSTEENIFSNGSGSTITFKERMLKRTVNIPYFFMKDVILAGGFFYILYFIGLFSKKYNLLKFSALWFILCTLPTLLVIGWTESRYFYVHAIPLAMISYLGFLIIYENFGKISKNFQKISYVLLMIILLSSTIFPYYMELELSEYKMTDIVEKLVMDYSAPSASIPNIVIISPDSYSDFSFLSFVYPYYSILTSEGEYDAEIIKRNINDKYRVKNLEDLRNIKSKKFYICNKKFRNAFYSEIRNIFGKPDVYVSDGKCALSWMWSHENVNMNLIFEDDPYLVFEVSVSN